MLLSVVSELIVRVSAGTYPEVPNIVLPSTVRLLFKVVDSSTRRVLLMVTGPLLTSKPPCISKPLLKVLLPPITSMPPKKHA